jgi:DNA-binding NarL/FixJ family response regulator
MIRRSREEVPSVLLVDDRVLTRHALRVLLDAESGVNVVGEAADIAEAAKMVENLKPDVIVADGLAHNLDVIDLARTITCRYGAEAPPIILLVNSPARNFSSAFRAGVRAFFVNQSSLDEFIAAVLVVAGGYTLLIPDRELPDGGGMTMLGDAWEDSPAQTEELTSRELDVLRLVAQGFSNSEISGKLSVSESTVKSHVRNMLAKLGLRNRVHAVIFAHRNGITHAITAD